MAYRSKSADKSNENITNGQFEVGIDHQRGMGGDNQLIIGSAELQTSPDTQNKENASRGRSPDAYDKSSWSDGIKTRVSRSLEKLMTGIKLKLNKDDWILKVKQAKFGNILSSIIDFNP